MKTLQDVLTELQAVDTTELTGVVLAIKQTVTDLQAIIAATPGTTAPTVMGVTVTFSDNSTQNFIPAVPTAA